MLAGEGTSGVIVVDDGVPTALFDAAVVDDGVPTALFDAAIGVTISGPFSPNNPRVGLVIMPPIANMGTTPACSLILSFIFVLSTCLSFPFTYTLVDSG